MKGTSETPITDQPVNEAETTESKLMATLHGQKPDDSQVLVAFSQQALRQIEAHCASDLTREVGGVLLGHSETAGISIRVKVMAALAVNTEDHGPVHFTFTADSWAQLHHDKAERFPDLEIVGWYHTHPDLGVFYSADDVIVHSAAFVLPWHVGLVIDPVRNESFLVGWQPDEHDPMEHHLDRIDGYYELLDQQPTTVVTWRPVRSSVWQQVGYGPELKPDDGPRSIYTPQSDMPSLPPVSPWWGIALGGLSLIISILLLIDRLLAGVN